MATIKDIAQLAKVSQGTVSNVLNGKGIVSSAKIKMVEDAAAQLGYTINERAKILRKGKSKLFAVILPNLRLRKYIDFYISFTRFLENHGYSVMLFISDNNPETEQSILPKIKSAMAAGVVTFSCLPSNSTVYEDYGFAFHEVLYVERNISANGNYIGFEYGLCADAIANRILNEKYSSVILITDDPSFSNEQEFINSFMQTISSGTHECTVIHLHSDFHRIQKTAFQALSRTVPDVICFSTYGYAKAFREILDNFYQGLSTEIFTVSPLFTMPESRFEKYELNYGRLGHMAARIMRDQEKSSLKKTTELRLENTGFRNWVPSRSRCVCSNEGKRLHVLTLDSPAAKAMKSLSRLYSSATGVDVSISVFSYEEIHEVLTSMDSSSMYDIIRLDVTWLSWFAEKLLLPLEEIDRHAGNVCSRYVKELGTRYSHVNGKLYGLPISPSTQLLFYRKDLFESTGLKRLYQESYKSVLRPPRDFSEYNQIARFFTKTLNPHSPVEYGSSATLGSTGVAATEFLTRYFALTDHLFDSESNVLLTSIEAQRALKHLVDIKVASPEQPFTWWTNAAEGFAQGNVAMSILYSNFASELVNKDSKVVNKIGYAVVPGANPIIGGGSLGISRYSKNPQLAYDY